jgi:hypothetical protein
MAAPVGTALTGYQNGGAGFVVPELRAMLPQYEIIRDCIMGEQQIKYRKDKYLPRPNSSDLSAQNVARYDAYLGRAVFYNVTKRTVSGLVGQVFSREPIIEVPKALDPIIEDATGLGIGMQQLAKKTAGYALSYGRSGIHIDYPDTGGAVTQAEIQSGDIRPLFMVYDPKDIINWRWVKRGGRKILTLVVLRESYVISDDGFVELRGPMYKVLRLVNNEYTITTYRQTNVVTQFGETIIPRDPAGKAFNTIPFSFIGSENNEPDVDDPPLYDLAALNVAHYRNSADYEESCYVTGQPTAWFSGLTQQWVKEVLHGEVQMGSRAAIPLPSGAAAGIIQPDPNTLPKAAMEHKEQQMVALGAKLVQPPTVVRTATEATIDQSYETSTLSASADNVSDAFTFALRWAARFSGEDDTKIKFELNTEFDLIKLDANERAQLITEWQGQAITFGELRANLRRAGIANSDEAAALTAIMAEAEKFGFGKFAPQPKAPGTPGGTTGNTPAPRSTPAPAAAA